MKKKDLTEMQTVCSVYSMCYCLNELLDEVVSDLPEEICTDLFRDWLKNFIHDIENYNASKESMFLSACEDADEKE